MEGSDGYDIEGRNGYVPLNGYVGPWNTAEDIFIEVTPSAAADVNIFLADGVNYAEPSTFNYYGICKFSGIFSLSPVFVYSVYFLSTLLG